MSAIRSWKLFVAGLAAAVVIAGGVGMTILQLRAGDANEPGPPNIDTLGWVTERSDRGFIVRRPREWPSKTFDDFIARRFSVAGIVIVSRPYEFRSVGESSMDFSDLPPNLAALHVAAREGGPAPFTREPNTPFPLVLEEAVRDPRSSRDGVMLRRALVVDGKTGWAISVWIGNAVGRRDAEIVRRIFSSFGFPSSTGGALSLEEQMIAHEIAESYRGARAALKGRPHTHPGFATDRTGSPECGGHTCGLVVFQITGGLRFRVLVDVIERRAIAFN